MNYHTNASSDLTGKHNSLTAIHSFTGFDQTVKLEILYECPCEFRGNIDMIKDDTTDFWIQGRRAAQLRRLLNEVCDMNMGYRSRA